MAKTAPREETRQLSIFVVMPPQVPACTEYIQPLIFPDLGRSLYNWISVISTVAASNVTVATPGVAVSGGGDGS